MICATEQTIIAHKDVYDAVKAEFAYGILNKGILADGSVGKLYNDEPQISVGIVYAGMFRL